ncbi:hypothetical protein ACET3Z_027222 [Daucus carota]
MDSSTETTLLESQSSSAFPKKNIQKPCILTSIFIITLLIAGIVTVTTVVIIRQSSPNDYTPSKYIQIICSFAPYKDLCISTLSSSVSTKASGDDSDTHIFPANIIFYSFQLSVYQLIHLANISNPDNIPELQECQALLNNEVSGLNDSAASSRNLYFFTGLEVDEYLEVFNRMETYQQACLDRLEESGSTVIDEIRLNVQNARKYMSNSRAILLNRKIISDSIYGRSTSSRVDYFLPPGELAVLTRAEIRALNAWISAAMTDQETCLDGLEEMGSTVCDEVRAKVQVSRQCMSYSLAILASIQPVRMFSRYLQ